ncbi:MAG: glycosyltransferase family 4 protein [Nitrospinota bacterium]
MNVLVIGKDSTVFNTGPSVFGDTRKRQMYHAKVLRERAGEKSSFRLICYSNSDVTIKEDFLADGLTLYPTRSAHRATFLWGTIKVLPRVLRGWKPDLITTQCPWEEGTLAFILSKVLKTSFLPQVHFDLFSESWKKEHWLNSFRRKVASFLICRSDGVRVVSKKVKKDIIEKLGVAPEKIFVVPVGINFSPTDSLAEKEKFKSRISPALKKNPVLLFVGRFYAPKNLTLWVEIASLVLKRIPKTKFVMAGDGDLFGAVKQMVRKRGLEKNFFFLGSVGHEQLPDVYAASDAFLLTSFYEGNPAVVKEALISGIPVVSTECLEPGELVINGKTGFIIPSRDKNRLAEAVVKLLEDKMLALKMGAVGKKYIEKNYSIKVLVDKLIESWIKVGRVIRS